MPWIVTTGHVSAAADLRPPSAPTAVSAVNVTDFDAEGVQQVATVRVSWDPSVDDVGVVKYLILRNGTEIAETLGARQQVNLDDLPHGTSSLQVQAVDAAGNRSARSRPVPVAMDRVRPSAPTLIDIDYRLAFGRTFVRILVEDPPDPSGIAADGGYTMFVDGRPYRGFYVRENSTRGFVTALVDAGDHWFQVSVTDQSGNTSGRSRPLRATVPQLDADDVAPSSPTNPSAVLTNEGTVRFEWDASTDDVAIDRYVVFELAADPFTDDPVELEAAVSDGDQTSATWRALRNGPVRFVVRAFDTSGTQVRFGQLGNPSEPSTEVVVDIPISSDRIPTIPGRPEADTISDIDAVGGLLIDGTQYRWRSSFDAEGNAIGKYRVLLDGAEYAVVDNLPEPFFSRTEISPFPAGEHTVQVQAIDADGNESLLSEPIEVDDINPEPPLPPAWPVAAVDGNDVTLIWTPRPASEQVVGYRVVGDDIGQGSDLLVPDEAESSDFDMPVFGSQLRLARVEPGIHTVRVVAVDHDGFESEPSRPITFRVHDSTVN